MKPHLIIKLYQPRAGKTPHWEDILVQKGGAPTSFIPQVDQILRGKWRRPFWVTYNYKPKAQSWTPAEVQQGFNRIYRLILQRNADLPKELIEQIQLVPEVESVKAGQIVQTRLPEEQLAGAQSLSRRYRQDWTYLPEAHQFTQGHPSIRIAVLDTGFETTHPEISHAMLPGKDFVNIIDGAQQFIGDYLDFDDIPEDAVGHGTHVAGIIAGRGLNMPIGVAPRCKLLPVKVLGALKRKDKIVGAGLVDNINCGMKWAVDQGADVINMSLGIKQTGKELPHEEVTRYAISKGISVVAASGNNGQEDLFYPGALPGVITVGACDQQGLVAPFSTYGNHVSIMAPGSHIYSCFLNGSYSISSGTSQASPFVAGAIALLKSYALSRGKQLRDPQIKYLLKHTSDKMSSQFKHVRSGFGKINLLDALKLYQYKQ